MKLYAPKKTFRNMNLRLCHNIRSHLDTFIVRNSKSVAEQEHEFSPPAEVLFSWKFLNSLNVERISQQVKSLLFQKPWLPCEHRHYRSLF